MAAQHSRYGDYSTRYKFNGKEQDEATGFYYYGARYYEPSLSRWLSTDPLAEKYQGFSPYNYTLNNPINLVDPDGRVVGDPPSKNDTRFLISAKITGTLRSLKTKMGIRSGKQEITTIMQITNALYKENINESGNISYERTGTEEYTLTQTTIIDAEANISSTTTHVKDVIGKDYDHLKIIENRVFSSEKGDSYHSASVNYFHKKTIEAKSTLAQQKIKSQKKYTFGSSVGVSTGTAGVTTLTGLTFGYAAATSAIVGYFHYKMSDSYSETDMIFTFNPIKIYNNDKK